MPCIFPEILIDESYNDMHQKCSAIVDIKLIRRRYSYYILKLKPCNNNVKHCILLSKSQLWISHFKSSYSAYYLCCPLVCCCKR